MSTDHKLVLEDLEPELPNVTFEYQREENAIKINLQSYWATIASKDSSKLDCERTCQRTDTQLLVVEET
jgi:hypothetical protein